jgi:hypothetical protein
MNKAQKDARLKEAGRQMRASATPEKHDLASSGVTGVEAAL